MPCMMASQTACSSSRCPCNPSTSGRLSARCHASTLTASIRKVSFCNVSKSLSLHCQRRRGLSLRAATEGSEVYKGAFGEWSVDESDVKEVLGYRAGLSVAAAAPGCRSMGNVFAALLMDTLLMWSPLDGSSLAFLRYLENAIALLGAAGFGVSLYLIHIYVTPIKRTLQLLWAAGVIGGTTLMVTQPQPITEYVASHQGAVWAVGPLFAAVTGVAFKEGVCYGKPECVVLFFLTPALLLGHLSGAVAEGPEKALLAAFVATSVLFAARKYTQAIKDDIGDKSVFQFQAMSEEEQERLLAERRQRQPQEY